MILPEPVQFVSSTVTAAAVSSLLITSNRFCNISFLMLIKVLKSFCMVYPTSPTVSWDSLL